MEILFLTNKTETRESFTCDISNTLQLLDYCKANKPELYKKLIRNEYSYTVYKNGDEKAYPLRKELVTSDISLYGTLVIAERMEGGVSAIAGALIAWGVSTIVAYVVAVVIVVAIVIALGYIIRALTPNKKLTGEQDPSESNRIFNGVPNITEQGGSVPIVVGNCLFGGVRIGLKFEPTSQAYTDIRVVSTFTEAMNYPSNWLKLT